ncbi:unnamed protein product [Cylindrotheca closterium]|uniref:Arf-GAP domain-containing protein n=1 Tax=Cylindrotheca closterium TaxID=2856 RepID=A0AAD2PVE9_9STRA|nr:unnamed protein product [Cylindrotheca closterium]
MLGISTTQIKSVSVGSWAHNDILAMERGGNCWVNTVYEAQLVKKRQCQKPTDSSEMLQRHAFCHLKYVKRWYYCENMPKAVTKDTKDGDSSIYAVSSVKESPSTTPKNWEEPVDFSKLDGDPWWEPSTDDSFATSTTAANSSFDSNHSRPSNISSSNNSSTCVSSDSPRGEVSSPPRRRATRRMSTGGIAFVPNGESAMPPSAFLGHSNDLSHGGISAGDNATISPSSLWSSAVSSIRSPGTPSRSRQQRRCSIDSSFAAPINSPESRFDRHSHIGPSKNNGNDGPSPQKARAVRRSSMSGREPVQTDESAISSMRSPGTPSRRRQQRRSSIGSSFAATTNPSESHDLGRLGNDGSSNNHGSSGPSLQRPRAARRASTSGSEPVPMDEWVISSMRSPGSPSRRRQHRRSSIGGAFPSSYSTPSQPSVNPRLTLTLPGKGLDMAHNTKKPARRFSLPDFIDDDFIDSVVVKPQVIDMEMSSRSFGFHDPSTSNEPRTHQRHRNSISKVSQAGGLVPQPDREIARPCTIRDRRRGSISNTSQGAASRTNPRQMRRASISGPAIKPDDAITASAPRQRRRGSINAYSQGLTYLHPNGDTTQRQSLAFLRESLGTMNASEAPKW